MSDEVILGIATLLGGGWTAYLKTMASRQIKRDDYVVAKIDKLAEDIRKLEGCVKYHHGLLEQERTG